MIRKQEATGKTVDEARAKACALLGVQADDLNVSCEVLEMPQKTGFLGLKLTPAKVCVSVEERMLRLQHPLSLLLRKRLPCRRLSRPLPWQRSLLLRQHSRKQRPKSLLPPLQKLLQSSPLPRKRSRKSPS